MWPESWLQSQVQVEATYEKKETEYILGYRQKKTFSVS